MRILFTACPMYGHVNTVLPLALAAQRAGHHVSLATGPDLVAHVRRSGVVAWPVGPTHEEAGGGPDADWMAYFADSAERRAHDLVPRARAWRPDLVVSEETELAGPVTAAAVGARLAIHGLGIMPSRQIWDVFAAALGRSYGRWGVTADVEEVRAAAYLEICPPALQTALGPGDGDRIWTSTRPIRPAMGEGRPGEGLPDELAALPRVDTVHLTLGTVFHHNRAVLAAAIEGLRDLPVNVVVAAGPGVDPREFGPQPDHVVIMPYVPHALLLPRCRLVVSQGGAGIMFGALAHGLPQLLIPQGAEQFLNAEACQRAGASLTLHRGGVSPAAVATAVGRLLDDTTFAVAAKEVQAEIARMPAADEVVASLMGRRHS
jgi:UDP:flavonoid glycosyltransferase YjiC (YdhE family)